MAWRIISVSLLELTSSRPRARVEEVPNCSKMRISARFVQRADPGMSFKLLKNIENHNVFDDLGRASVQIHMKTVFLRTYVCVYNRRQRVSTFYSASALRVVLFNSLYPLVVDGWAWVKGIGVLF